MENIMRGRAWVSVMGLVVAGMIGGACGGGGEQKAEQAPSGGAAQAAPGGPLTPQAGGKVITVEMITDDQGNNRFNPAEFEANRGDVIRFSLVTGVHNANFLPDSNPGAQGLPAASPLLQVPGQMYDVAVNFAPGRYYFQCDPHALLGMIGYVTVK